MVRVGDKYEEQGVTVHITEVQPIPSISGTPSFMIGYYFTEPSYTSPEAKFWMEKSSDIRKEVKKLVTYYLSIKPPTQGLPRQPPVPEP